MADEVVIDHRFRGPPASANGGYTCGLLARALEAPAAEVNLRAPPPLAKPLRLERDGQAARLLDGDRPVADARALPGVDARLPEPPPLDAAAGADPGFSYFGEDHPFRECFVCGLARTPGDGLRIHPAPLEDSGLVACVWIPDAGLAGGDGAVAEEIAWGALDCPGGIAAHHFARSDATMVLARLRGTLLRPITLEEPHIVVGWPDGSEGRKHHAGTAIFDRDGEPVAYSGALWIELREAPRID